MSTARLRSDRAAKVRPSLSTAHLTTMQATSASLRDVLARGASGLGLRDDAVTPEAPAGSQRRAATKAEPARGLSIVSSGLSLAIARLSELAKAEQDELFDLFERNMRAMYEASTDGYDAKAKRREILHAESRFIVARDPATSSAPAGYVLSRFELDEDANGRKLAVVYCYELQIAESYRGQGLARVLMGCLRSLGQAFGMDKVMLTVFKHNDGGRAFYEKLGRVLRLVTAPLIRGSYATDETDPSHDPEEADADYSILSIPVAAG